MSHLHEVCKRKFQKDGGQTNCNDRIVYIHIKLRQYLFTVNVLCFAVEGKSLTNFRYFRYVVIFGGKCIARCVQPATHLAILFADHSEFDRQRILPLIDADTLGDFLRRSRRFGTLNSFPDYVQAIFRVHVCHFEK